MLRPTSIRAARLKSGCTGQRPSVRPKQGFCPARQKGLGPVALPLPASAHPYRSRSIGLFSVTAACFCCIAFDTGCRSDVTPLAAAPSPPRRILSHTLATDEILLELVPVERVVGVTNLVDDPEISSVPGRYPDHVPRLREADAERIIGLNPDLVCV